MLQGTGIFDGSFLDLTVRNSLKGFQRTAASGASHYRGVFDPSSHVEEEFR